MKTLLNHKKLGGRLLLSLAVACVLSFTAAAQDSRGRVASTIVADGLAQLPAQNLDVLEQVMSEIAGTGGEGIAMLVQYLNESEEGKGAAFEYAIDGLTSYVSAAGREALREPVRDGLKRAISTTKSDVRRAFYIQQLAKIASEADVPFFESLLTDNYLKAYALAAISPFGKDNPPSSLNIVAKKSSKVALFREKIENTPAAKRSTLLLQALKSPSRDIRTNALEMLSEVTGPQQVVNVCKVYPKLKFEAQTDVLRWLGNIHATDPEAMDIVVAGISSTDSVMSTAAIEAAGRIGGERALKALVAALDGPRTAAAKAALTAFNGDIKPGVLAALTEKGNTVSTNLVSLAGIRLIREAYSKLIPLLRYARLHEAAATSLSQLVTTETYPDLLERFRIYPDLYYLLLAQRGEKTDIEEVVAAAKGTTHTRAARAALMKVNSTDVVPQLFEIAQSDTAARHDMLIRALALTQGASWASLTKYQLYKQALEMQPSTPTADKFLAALGTLNNEPALMLAAKYMDVKDNDLAAASAVTTLINKNEPFRRGAHIREMLMRAKTVFESHKDNADAGYAIDQVNTLLPKIVDDPAAATAKVTTLSDTERREGFELLFDGTNLDKWMGNKTDYVPIDGAIYVSASYGSEGNLYTREKYSDFVFRFEFCFARPGINNGVGIRTREGVDAAYEGMEIQILDHDDPIYKGLRPYQQHGSVYGIIVPEHVNFGPLGTWNTEEIRAEGDHIRVTVNGQVILDGNIREACQGHNIAPEEGKPNPYTVDHQSHPGLFNRDGLICFCGHGEGLKLRNIRVKRL